MKAAWMATVITIALLPGGSGEAQAVRLIDVRQVPADTLRDVAVATFEGGRPTIYYNPALLQQFGPRMAAFFLAHEYGHIRYGHTGAALVQGEGDLSLLRQRQELEADCYAAALLAETDRGAIDAALRFFTRMGPFRYDAYHPTGSQRAAKILSCLPEPAPATPDTTANAPGATARPVAFTVTTGNEESGDYGYEARIWIDDVPVGVISSLRQPASVAVQRFASGAHQYRITVQLYTFDSMLQLNPGGTASGNGLLSVHQGDVFAVHWSPGESPTLARH